MLNRRIVQQQQARIVTLFYFASLDACHSLQGDVRSVIDLNSTKLHF